ncbi:hypothetical protein ACOME3_008223 [Neoechinorhynchus agilis]
MSQYHTVDFEDILSQVLRSQKLTVSNKSTECPNGEALRINGENVIIQTALADNGDRKPLRVAIFVESYYPFISGVARRLQELVLRMAQQGHHVCLITGDKKSEDWLTDKPTIKSNVQIKVLTSICAVDKLKNSLHFIVPSFTLYKTLADFNPDIVHICEQTPSSCLCFVYARILEIPVVWSTHSDVVTYIRRFVRPQAMGEVASFLFCILRYLFLNRSDHLLTVSNYFKKHLVDTWIVHRPISIWHTGVNFDTFNTVRRSQEFRQSMFRNDVTKMHLRLLLTVGRIGPEKRFEFLAEVVQKCEDIFLCVVGDGAYIDTVKPLFPKDRTYFMGALYGDDLAAAYASADFFIYASESETFGQVFLESMACGTPILAPRTPQMCEFFIDRHHGFLWETNNIKSAVGIVKKAIKREPFGSNAAKYVREQRSWALATEQCIVVYEKVLSDKLIRKRNRSFIAKSLEKLECAVYASIYAISMAIAYPIAAIFVSRNL